MEVDEKSQTGHILLHAGFHFVGVVAIFIHLILRRVVNPKVQTLTDLLLVIRCKM